MAVLISLGSCSSAVRNGSAVQQPTNPPSSGVDAVSADAVPDRERAGSSEPSPAKLASFMRSAYQRTSRIEFHANVKHGNRAIYCTVVSDFESHRLEVRMANGPVVFTMTQHYLENGNTRIKENNFVTLKQVEYVVTPAEFTSNAWEIRCDGFNNTGIDGCLFGGYLKSWVGSSARMREFWHKVISAGEYTGTQLLNGMNCHVIATCRAQRPNEEIWIDSGTGLVTRWRDQVRDRVFTYHSREVRDGDDR